MSYHWWNTHTSPSPTPHYTSGLLVAHFPTLSDLAILPLFHPIFSCSSWWFNSIMDVHKLNSILGSFQSFLQLIHSQCLLPPLHVFVEAGPGSLSAFTPLTLSLHQPDAQVLWQITPICFSVQHSVCVDHMDTYVIPAQKHSNIPYSNEVKIGITKHAPHVSQSPIQCFRLISTH